MHLLEGFLLFQEENFFIKEKNWKKWMFRPSSILHPEVVIVDELAHTNIEGSKNEKRWQDVMEILNAGINVISAVNIQHIESLNEEIKNYRH